MVLGQGTQNLCSSCFSSAAFIKGAATTWKSHFCLFPCKLKRITSIVLKLKEMRMKIYLSLFSLQYLLQWEVQLLHKAAAVVKGTKCLKIVTGRKSEQSPLFSLLPFAGQKGSLTAALHQHQGLPGWPRGSTTLLTSRKTLMQVLVSWKSANFKSKWAPFAPF